MKVSEQIAGLLGPALLVITLSEAANLHAIANTTPAVIYLYGGVLFVAGLAILRAHNHWTFSWSVLVTLVGWALLIGGVVRMFAPGTQRNMSDTTSLAVIAVLFIVAVFLTVKAYVPDLEGGVRRRSVHRRRRRR